MDKSRLSDQKITKPRKLLTLDRSDFPLHVQFSGTNYILVVTKSNKLLLQKPLE